MSASESLTRIVSLVAELTRREREGEPGATLGELARLFAVTPRQIENDLRTLTVLGDNTDGDWLLSLRVWQQEDRVSVTSQGPFRRPVGLSPVEMLAVQVALINEDRPDLAARLAGADQQGIYCGSPGSVEETIHYAVRTHSRIRIHYAAEGAPPGVRTIEPHQWLEHRQRTYVIAWCEESGGWRHFRLDRITRAELPTDFFETREDFVPVARPEDLFRGRGEVEDVTVKFKAGAARWARERYPRHEGDAEGNVLVRFQVASRDWLVRLVLEVGADAEVLEPAEYRRFIRDAVA